MADCRYVAEKIQPFVIPKSKEVLKELWGHINMMGASLKGLPHAKFEISEAPKGIMPIMDYYTE